MLVLGRRGAEGDLTGEGCVMFHSYTWTETIASGKSPLYDAFARKIDVANDLRRQWEICCDTRAIDCS